MATRNVDNVIYEMMTISISPWIVDAAYAHLVCPLVCKVGGSIHETSQMVRFCFYIQLPSTLMVWKNEKFNIHLNSCNDYIFSFRDALSDHLLKVLIFIILYQVLNLVPSLSILQELFKKPIILRRKYFFHLITAWSLKI